MGRGLARDGAEHLVGGVRRLGHPLARGPLKRDADGGHGGELRALTDAVHEAGGKVSIQLGHCGGFSKNKDVAGGAPGGPSGAFNAYGLMHGVPRIRALSAAEVAELPAQFAAGAERAKRAGFDAVELHCGHGYLISQFLSPAVNKRRDGWGGSLEGRMRLAVESARAIREAVGDGFAVLAKVNTRDGVRGGLEIEESVAVSKALVSAGVDALVPSGGLVFKNAFFLMRGRTPLREMVEVEKHLLQKWALRLFGPAVMRPHHYSPNFFFEDARKILAGTGAPVALLGGVDSSRAMREAFAAGFEYVAMGRALLADPDFLERLAQGEEVVTRCTHCNCCVAEMDRGGVRCVLDDEALGR